MRVQFFFNKTLLNTFEIQWDARFERYRRASEKMQGQLLEGVECHIYLYCFTFDDINLNRVLSLLSYFQKNIAIRKCVQIKNKSGMH